LYAAVSPEAYTLSGGYLSDCRPVMPTVDALNDEYARRAYLKTKEILGV